MDQHSQRLDGKTTAFYQDKWRREEFRLIRGVFIFKMAAVLAISRAAAIALPKARNRRRSSVDCLWQTTLDEVHRAK